MTHKEPDAVDDVIKYLEIIHDGSVYALRKVCKKMIKKLEEHQAAMKNKIVIDVGEVKDVPISGIGVLVLEKLKQLEVDGDN